MSAATKSDLKSMRAAFRKFLWRPIRRLVNDRRAVSAVEFALVLPVMLTLYVGGNQVRSEVDARSLPQIPVAADPPAGQRPAGGFGGRVRARAAGDADTLCRRQPSPI